MRKEFLFLLELTREQFLLYKTLLRFSKRHQPSKPQDKEGMMNLAEQISGNGITALAWIGTIGALAQTHKIWRKQSGKSVLNEWALVSLGGILSCVVYGLSLDPIKWPMVKFGLIRAVPAILTAYLLWRYEGYSRRDKQTLFFLVFLLIMMIATPFKHVGYIVLSSAGIQYTYRQGSKIIEEEDRGSVSVVSFLLSGMSATFWTIYGFSLPDPWMAGMSASYCYCFVRASWMWFRYPGSGVECEGVDVVLEP